MKKVMVLFVIVLTLTSMAMNASMLRINAPGSELMARRVISALQRNSPEQYRDLFPTLADFQAEMQENAQLYGDYLKEAKQVFATEYQRVLLPAVNASFDKIRKDGLEKGI